MTDTTRTPTTHPPLLGVFVVLMVLLAATVALATVDLGVLGVPFMLTIALAKTFLIVLYFMHARYEGWLTWVVVVTGIVWMVLLVAITLTDYWSRGWMPIPEGWMP